MKKIFAIVFALLISCLVLTPISAKEERNDDPLKIVSGGSIIYNNVNVALFVEYQNNSVALNYIKDTYKTTLSYLETTFGVPELSDSTYKDYYFLFTGSFADEYAKDIDEIADFIDIYENHDQNVLISQLSCQNSLLRDSNLNDNIGAMLPYTSGIVINHPETRVSFNLTNARTYAQTYYNTRNSEYPDYGNEDCTNFASQILHAGGKSYVGGPVNGEEYGWWYHLASSNPKVYSASISWRRANTFANYWGVDYSVKSHRSFANYLQPGDFIAFDRNSDGDWNHIGFVCYKDATERTYNGKTYYDYKVAQHSSNYYSYASTNGWPSSEDKNETYGVIRI